MAEVVPTWMAQTIKVVQVDNYSFQKSFELQKQIFHQTKEPKISSINHKSFLPVTMEILEAFKHLNFSEFINHQLIPNIFLFQSQIIENSLNTFSKVSNENYFSSLINFRFCTIFLKSHKLCLHKKGNFLLIEMKINQ